MACQAGAIPDNSELSITPTEKQRSIGKNYTELDATVAIAERRYEVNSEFLQWFFAQKPFRPSRLVMKDNAEVTIINPVMVGFNPNGTIRVLQGKDQGMGTYCETYEIANIVEIRQ
jgi:hypothetical protein